MRRFAEHVYDKGDGNVKLRLSGGVYTDAVRLFVAIVIWKVYLSFCSFRVVFFGRGNLEFEDQKSDEFFV